MVDEEDVRAAVRRIGEALAADGPLRLTYPGDALR